MEESPEKLTGFLEVHIQRAREIHNICIYGKQDVYAKICLTEDPGASIVTGIVHGGGEDPEFNEKLRLGVGSFESSLKCEIWMLSRVKNYLEDQLLGFALVPLPEIMKNGGKLSGEFSLTSTDLVHSPAGFVQLSLSFSGYSPALLNIHQAPEASNSGLSGYGSSGGSGSGKNTIIHDEYQKIEFPDPEMVQMVSEIFAAEDCSSSCGSLAAAGSSEIEVDSRPELAVAIGMEAVPEVLVVHDEIVDLYLKSMQQFTESLAKMKLPVDVAENAGDEMNTSAPNAASSRVFYGSRAFF